MKIIPKFDDDRKEKWGNRIAAIICFMVWTYLCLHIGAYIERQRVAEQKDLFLHYYEQRLEELKEEAPIYTIREF